MQALYDSEAQALQIDLEGPGYTYDHDEDVTGRCTVSVTAEGRAVAIEVLSPQRSLSHDLREAAVRYSLDTNVLLAIAQTAVQHPDREVLLKIRDRVPA